MWCSGVTILCVVSTSGGCSAVDESSGGGSAADESSSSSSSSRDGLIGPLPAKCRPEAFDAHSCTTFRERGKTG